LDLSPLLQHALSLAGYVPDTTMTGWKSCRCAVPSPGPEAIGLQAAPFSKISESPQLARGKSLRYDHFAAAHPQLGVAAQITGGKERST